MPSPVTQHGIITIQEKLAWRYREFIGCNTHGYITRIFGKLQISELYISNIDGRYNSGHIAYFGVRFEPEGVRELLASAPKKSATGPEQQEPEDEDQGQKGPPVSETHLRQWYALYRSVYHGPGDTMEMALRSARGMFPGKFVSRDAIRKLAGGRTRGRKQRATET